jgi:hypothetical protein
MKIVLSCVLSVLVAAVSSAAPVRVEVLPTAEID